MWILGLKGLNRIPAPPDQYADSHHCFPNISYGTYEENLFNNQDI